MSAKYENIPPERELAYLENAEQAANEAAEPVIKGLADLAIGNVVAENDEFGKVVKAAEDITKESGNLVDQATHLGDEAETYAHENDYRLGDFSTGIGDEAEKMVNNGGFIDELNKMGPNAKGFEKKDYGKEFGIRHPDLKPTDNELAFLREGLAEDLPQAAEEVDAKKSKWEIPSYREISADDPNRPDNDEIIKALNAAGPNMPINKNPIHHDDEIGPFKKPHSTNEKTPGEGPTPQS